MSYENAPATKLLATRCAVCGRPLCDAVSVEIGIGPECREKYGYSECINDTNRSIANQLVHEIALKQHGFDVTEATRQLRNLGFARLAEKIAHRLFSIRIEEHGAVYHVFTPFTEAGVKAFREIPGRRWDAMLHASVIPVASKNKLWAALKKGFPGHTFLAPNGDFMSIPQHEAFVQRAA
jgi:hypothetical protein